MPVCADTSGIYQTRPTAYKKTPPEDGLIQSETCRAYIESEEFCASCWFIYILQDAARFTQYHSETTLQLNEPSCLLETQKLRPIALHALSYIPSAPQE